MLKQNNFLVVLNFLIEIIKRKLLLKLDFKKNTLSSKPSNKNVYLDDISRVLIFKTGKLLNQNSCRGREALVKMGQSSKTDAFVSSFTIWEMKEISVFHSTWKSTELIQNLSTILTGALQESHHCHSSLCDIGPFTHILDASVFLPVKQPQ